MKKISAIIILFAVITGCKSGKEKLVEKITESEKNLLKDSSAVVDRKKGQEIINLYQEYALQYKDDTLSAEYLFRAAEISNGIGQYKNAIELYRKSSTYNSYSKQPIALFLQGFIYENQLQDYANARKVYEEFLQKYPNHKLAADVNFSIANLGKSPEELVKMFEKNDSTTSKADSVIAKK